MKDLKEKEVVSRFIHLFLQRAVCGESFFSQCQKPIPPYSSSSATSCWALGRGARLTLTYNSKPEQSPSRFNSLTSGRGALSASCQRCSTLLLLFPCHLWLLKSLTDSACMSHQRWKPQEELVEKTPLRHCLLLLLIVLLTAFELCDEDENEWRCSHSQQSLYARIWHWIKLTPLPRNHL